MMTTTSMASVTFLMPLIDLNLKLETQNSKLKTYFPKSWKVFLFEKSLCQPENIVNCFATSAYTQPLAAYQQ